MNYPKCWQKCIDKLDRYLTLSINDWNYYQLLGYMLSQIDYKLEPTNQDMPKEYGSTYPSDHPLIRGMKSIYTLSEKNPAKVKIFLDWCVSKYGARFNPKMLLANFNQYQNENLSQPTKIIAPKRTDSLPQYILDVIAPINQYITDYGSLVMQCKIDQNCVKALQSINFDLTILDQIK